jgi:hypothetical protein
MHVNERSSFFLHLFSDVFISGVWGLFAYDGHSLPYKIFKQPEPKELCHDINNDMELMFTFLPVGERNEELVWRYEIINIPSTYNPNYYVCS